jgi:hypothetical protein
MELQVSLPCSQESAIGFHLETNEDSTPNTLLLECMFYYHLTYALVISFLYVYQLKFSSILQNSIHATCHAHLNRLDLIITICSKEYISLNSSFCTQFCRF